MREPYRIESIFDILEIGKELSLSWFRGHPEIFNNLTPGIFRPKFEDQFIFKPQFELKIYEEFKRIAPSLSQFNILNYSDLEWLFVMQHYNMPTRLLDWTESILVASYFAVEKNFESDAELWAIYPDVLNHKYGFEGMPIIENNRDLQFLSSVHRHTKPSKLAEELDLKEIPDTPMALRPPLKFERMIYQQSVFTIHPKPDKNNSITDILKDNRHLIKYIIPHGFKQKIKNDLKSLGINKRTLFGDLTSLAESILEEEKTVAYGPPKPPDLMPRKKAPRFF